MKVRGGASAAIRRFVLWIALLPMIFLSACVLPPSSTAPAVIPPKELSLVSHISQGRGFVSRGRYDLAELEFRSALMLAPSQGSLYSDLGYVLSAQQRYSEAISYFAITLRFAPGDIAALMNLASTYYKMGELERAITVYEELLARNALGTITEFGVPNRKVLTAVELVDIYRNMSIVFNLMGDYGEAVCWSRKAVDSTVDGNQLSLHARLLLSMDRSQDAYDFLSEVISQRKELTPPPVMLDFGAAALAIGKFDAAEQALGQLALFSGVSRADEIDAQLLQVLVAVRKGEDSALLLQAVVEDEASVCDTSIADRRRYWPEAVVTEVASLIRTYCDDSRKSIFSAAQLFSR